MFAFSPMLRIQCFAIFIGIASNVNTHVQMAGRMPFALLLLDDLVWALFVGWWIVSIVLIRRKPAFHDDSPDGWFEHTQQVFWGGSAATLLSFWTTMPYADRVYMMSAVVLCMSPFIVEILGTLRSPQYGKRGFAASIVPFVIPLGIAPFLFLDSNANVRAIGLLLPLMCGGLWVTRELLQNVVDQLDTARIAAEDARDAKTRFLASASHDLGQPLQAARMFFDQALRSDAGPKRDKAVQSVHWAFDTSEHLLRQMLDHLRLESGQVAADMADVALGPLIARIAEMHEPAARLAGVSLVALPTALVVRADPALLERALGNFVGNAIRHAKARRVLIGARRSGARVRLWVIDDGTGIPVADRARLFEDYVQGSNHGDEIRGGFGLGLASVRRMADLMGGTAGFEPKWVNGSAFWLEVDGA